MSAKRINPDVPEIPVGYCLDGLDSGDCFIYNKILWLFCDDGMCIDLEDGWIEKIEADTTIQPVNITINWTKKGK